MESGGREERYVEPSELTREKRDESAPKYFFATETIEESGSTAVTLGVKKERVTGSEHPPAPIICTRGGEVEEEEEQKSNRGRARARPPRWDWEMGGGLGDVGLYGAFTEGTVMAVCTRLGRVLIIS
mmetsp:Transcript_13245/g.27025  ORF Transcript_13245/g.27025 Transcript_13245/m.27025 type:complete len:127 (+) Transcript_13245:369-749(+)